jgi:hypothetical protein
VPEATVWPDELLTAAEPEAEPDVCVGLVVTAPVAATLPRLPLFVTLCCANNPCEASDKTISTKVIFIV